MARTEVCSSVTGTVFKVVKSPGDQVEKGDEIVVVESMKMEIVIEAPISGRIESISVTEEGLVDEGQVIAVLEARP